MKKAVISFFLSLLIISSASIFQSTANASVNNTRISGENFIDDAIQISIRSGMREGSVVLANVEDFPDSMAGVTLASLKNAAILLTYKNDLEISVLQQLNFLRAKTVYLLGGPGALSMDIESTLKNEGFNTIRLAGLDRFKTAVAVGEEVIKERKGQGAAPDTAFVAYAHNFPDALSASAIAAKNGWPIVFTDTNELNTDTADALLKWGIKKVFITGGTGVVSANVESQLKDKGMSVERLGGTDRYETSMKIINRFDDGSFKNLFIATGKDFPDALAGSVYAVKMNGPVALYDKGGASGTVEDNIRTMLKDKKLYILGRDEVLPQADINELTKTAAFFNTAGKGIGSEAGVFNTDDSKLVTISKNAGYEANLGKLNGMIGRTYGFSYVPGLSQDGVTSGVAKFVYDKATNRYGLQISGWRQSYNSNGAENRALNVILETLYFFCGDKEVAYALWSFRDKANIDGYANTDEFGFKDTGVSENGFSAVMKGIEVEINHVGGVTTIYFK